MATVMTCAILVILNLVTIGLLMRCGAKGFQSRDATAAREVMQAAHASTVAVGKAAMLQFEENAKLRGEVRSLTEHITLLTELEQAKHTANFTNVDTEKIA